MVRISAHDLALELIDDCLHYGSWSNRTADALVERALDLDDEFAAANATRALFSVVIERLADLFEPALCDVYARLFSRIIARVLPDCVAEDLYTRYNRIRTVRRFAGGEINRIFVLSRVTLGADVAVTSVVLAAMKHTFPHAAICFVGPEKNAELFAADDRITPIPVLYGRGAGLRERLLAAMELRSAVDVPGTIVIDPDSRLTQLGLIPVCDDGRYYFFESRAFGGQSDLNLPQLTALWLAETFGSIANRPYLRPMPQTRLADYCVSWGVGENEDKRVSLDFESALVEALLAKGNNVLLDCGTGASEAERVSELQKKLASPHLLVHDGTYASFASHIQQARFYVGYDSAGQHVADASGVPLLSVFKGFPSERMLARWTPGNPSSTVLPVREQSDEDLLQQALGAIAAAP